MTLWILFGRFHPALVHFPIALLTVAAMLFVWARWRKKPELLSGARALVHLGGATAVLATVAGLSLASSEGFRGGALTLIEFHRNLAFATTGVAIIASALLLFRKEKSATVVVGLTLLSAGLVGATGHYGGMSVFGNDFYTPERLTEAEAGEGSGTTFTRKKREPIPPPPPGEAVDFVKHVKPIFKKSCYRCHDARKRKGGLRLDTKKWAFKGGDGGPSIVPGKPIRSKLFQSVSLPEDHEDYMPAKGDPLTDDEVETLRRWIAQGAIWPEGA